MGMSRNGITLFSLTSYVQWSAGVVRNTQMCPGEKRCDVMCVWMSRHLLASVDSLATEIERHVLVTDHVSVASI